MDFEFTAESVRKEQLEKRNSFQTETLAKIKDGIENAIESDASKFDFYGVLSEEVKDLLNEKGFSVVYSQCGMNEYCWRIGW